MPNLAEGMKDEVRRARKLKEEFLRMGPSGMAGATVIEADIREVEDAQASGNVINMLAAYDKLKTRIDEMLDEG